MITTRLFLNFILILLFAIVAASPALAGDDEWKPVDPAHLALKAPVVEKDADAEALFWEVHVKDELFGGDFRTVFQHYVRIKIFTDRGKELQSKIDIAYSSGYKISDIAGRTIKPDGTVVELKKDAIFDREIVRVSGIKLKSKSFAMPAVEPGAIIEYRWRESRGDHISFYLRLYFQRDIPVQLIKYYLKPLSMPGVDLSMRTLSFHAKFQPFQKEKDGYYSTQLTNVPAFREEPRMPPEDQVRPWMLVYYSVDKKLSPEKYWFEYGKEIYNDTKSSMKVNDEVRKAAAEAIGDATMPDEKLRRIFDYCRSKIKNVYDDASGMTASQRDKVKENNSPSDTIKRGMGTRTDIDMAFAALASAAGFDARIAKVSDRSDFFFVPDSANSYFLNYHVIAVRVGDEWRFYDPSSPYVPFGMLLWQTEGQQALVADPKEPVFVQTPLSPPEKSLQKRVARLSLSEDGTLEGDVRIEYTGHHAAERKEYNDEDSAEQREKTLIDSIKQRLSTAEVSQIKIENVTDLMKPFVYSYHVRVPGYAQRTGKRIFIQPAFFQKGIGSLFQTSERKYPIYFHYPWSEEDDVTITLPEGYALDTPEAPTPFNASNIVKYDVKLQRTTDGRTLIYKRGFMLNGMLFPVTSYPQLKQVFDILHQRDNHTITLKQSAAGQ